MRRPQFVDGPRVRLADGQDWSLPLAESLRGELALCLFLLTRNDSLSPPELDPLLSFGSDRLALEALQQAVRA